MYFPSSVRVCSIGPLNFDNESRLSQQLLFIVQGCAYICRDKLVWSFRVGCSFVWDLPLQAWALWNTSTLRRERAGGREAFLVRSWARFKSQVVIKETEFWTSRWISGKLLVFSGGEVGLLYMARILELSRFGLFSVMASFVDYGRTWCLSHSWSLEV